MKWFKINFDNIYNVGDVDKCHHFLLTLDNCEMFYNIIETSTFSYENFFYVLKIENVFCDIELLVEHLVTNLPTNCNVQQIDEPDEKMMKRLYNVRTTW